VKLTGFVVNVVVRDVKTVMKLDGKVKND